jgi:UDP-N-acetylglucosamine 2-epimerase (non-hydrolysing)
MRRVRPWPKGQGFSFGDLVAFNVPATPMVLAPLSSVPKLTTGRGAAPPLHLAVTRSSAIRLSSVVSALTRLGAPQTLVTPAGELPIDPEAPPRLPAPGGSRAAVAAAIERTAPACVVAAGDGDEVLEGALAAVELGIPIVRIGAGLRSGDRSEDEEITRVALDELAALLFADGEDAVAQLLAEGVPRERIRCVGSTVPDAVRRWQFAATRRPIHAELGIDRHRRYLLVALGRRATRERMPEIEAALEALAERTQVVACLPEGAERLRDAGVIVTPPLGYLDFLALELAAGAVLTDSACVQEETTVLGVPCFTFGHRSERALTLMYGTNAMLGDDPAEIAHLTPAALTGIPQPIPLWDGGAGRRIAQELLEWR